MVVYFVLLALTGLVTLSSFVPGLVVASFWFTFGVGWLLMVVAATAFVYLLALFPAVVLQNNLGYAIAALLVCAVAVWLRLEGQMLAQNLMARLKAQDKSPTTRLDAPPRVAAVRVAANASLTFPDELSLVLLRSGIDVVTLLGEDGQMLGQVRKDPVLAVYLDSSAEGPAAFTVWTEAVTRNAFTRTLSLRERRFLNGSQGMMRVTVAEGEGFDGRILLRHTVAQIARPILPTIIYPHTDEVMTARRPARLRFAAGGAGAVLAHAEVMQEALAGLGLTPEARADGPFEEMDFKSRRAARLQQLRSTVQSEPDRVYRRAESSEGKL